MRKGFTLIELMIVIAIIAIIAAIAIPNLLEGRVTANESAAAGTLKTLSANQITFQGSGYQDSDQNNVGEYGTLEALSGLIATSKVAAGDIAILLGPLASGAAGATERVANGYAFAAAIPDVDYDTAAPVYILEGTALPVADPALTARAAERHFIVGAMPDDYANSGRRPFLLTRDGQVRSPSAPTQIDQFFGAATPVNGYAGSANDIFDGAAGAWGAAAWPVDITGAIDQTLFPVMAR